jgi:hypothetical protein
MGTRGMLIIICNGRKYYLYNHFDSYDLDLWTLDDLKELLKEYTIAEIKQKITNIKWIPPEQHDCIPDVKVPSTYYRNLGGNDVSWYAMLRNTQGRFARNIEIGYGLDNGGVNVAHLDNIITLDLDASLLCNESFDPKTGELTGVKIQNSEHKKLVDEYRAAIVEEEFSALFDTNCDINDDGGYDIRDSDEATLDSNE